MLSIYEERIESAILGNLDEDWFEALDGRDLRIAGAGCLDAPDWLPAGSTRRETGCVSEKDRLYRASWFCARPVRAARTDEVAQSHSAREALANQLITEILAEEAAA